MMRILINFFILLEAGAILWNRFPLVQSICLIAAIGIAGALFEKRFVGYRILALDKFAALLLFPYVLKNLFYPVKVLWISNLLFAAALSAIGILLGPRILLFLEKRKISSHKIPGIVILCSLAFGITFSILPILQYMSFTTEMVDFGFMDQAIWNTLHGRILEVTSETGRNIPRLSSHFEPIYLFLSPFFLLLNNGCILFIIQTCAVTLGAWPVFRLSKKALDSSLMGLAMVLVYFLYPVTHLSLLFDFHGDVLAVPFLFWAIDVRRGRSCYYWLAVIGALFCKEYAALALMGFGVYLFLVDHQKIRGTATFAIALVWFLAVQEIIIPFFGQDTGPSLVSMNYAHVGGSEGIKGILLNMVLHPFKTLNCIVTPHNFEGLTYLFTPLFFLPFIGWRELLIALPLFAKDMLFGLDIGNHRPALMLPYLMFATVAALSKLNGEKRKIVLTIVIVCAAAGHFAIGESPLSQRFWRVYENKYRITERDRMIEKTIRMIPADVPITASGRLAPHLTHRQFCYVPPHPADLQKIDYAIFDTLEQRDRDWSPRKKNIEMIGRIQQDSEWEAIFSQNGLLLFKRKSSE